MKRLEELLKIIKEEEWEVGLSKAEQVYIHILKGYQYREPELFKKYSSKYNDLMRQKGEVYRRQNGIS